MISRWPIRNKLRLGIALLMCTVAAMSVTSFIGVYAFRGLAESIRLRAPELPLSSKVAGDVSKLGVTYKLYKAPIVEPELSLDNHTPPLTISRILSIDDILEQEFHLQLSFVTQSFERYRETLEHNQQSDDYKKIGVHADEQAAVAEFQATLDEIKVLSVDLRGFNEERLTASLARLDVLSEELPMHLHSRMYNFANEVRGQYRSWIAVNIIMLVISSFFLIALLRSFYVWVFRPLSVLIHGSRRVAAGDFDHRIRLDSQDEMAELAKDMNNMTRRFQEIRDDLDQQVQQRTKEVVRSEQLASVGFLAAGVAHEINNPLASIALCAESLEDRLGDIITGDDGKADEDHDAEISVLRDYLRMMQDEAFRCKDITEQLLDFSRLGDVEKQTTNLTELVKSVIEMVKHIGRYKAKTIDFQSAESIYGSVNAQELKQVVLNLLTNALDSLDPGGQVTLSLRSNSHRATLTVQDDGCGMTEEVRKHLFEPFFTRRRDGQGTGLGMSITYRIVNDHGGDIQAHSEGPGKGSMITVSLPLTKYDQKQKQNRQAA